MGVDYYSVLNVDRDAEEVEFRRSYKRLAMKWHPDKNPTKKEEAESMFKEVSKAYEVLSDPHKRAMFDKYGQQGLKSELPPPDPGASYSDVSHGGASHSGFSHGGASHSGFSHGGASHSGFSHGGASHSGFSHGGASHSGVSHGGASHSGASHSGASHGGASRGFGGGTGFCSSGASAGYIPFSSVDLFAGLSGFSESMRSKVSHGEEVLRPFGVGGGGGSFVSHGGPRKAAPIENKLRCSLEELYNGTSKKMKLTRDIVDIYGKRKQEEEILTIDVGPGWRKGTKIIFEEQGNVVPKVTPADLVFIIDEKLHEVYTRDRNDLVVTQKISLLEALTGCTVNLITLDGRNLTVPINRIIHPQYEEVVANEGFPLPKDPTKKGNLRIKFDIRFPTELTLDQKIGMEKIFAA